ncbi:MAG: hypothetical protein V1829_02100 [bacterium]
MERGNRKRRIKMNWKVFCVQIVFILISVSSVFAGSQATQTIVIRIDPIAEIALAGTGGRNQVELSVDERGIITESMDLLWTTNLEGLKIQVNSSLPKNMQGNILKVQAVNLVGHGNSTDPVIIDEIPKEIISGISREVGRCLLEYQFTPKLNAHLDRHIITYTLIQ